jgi:LacI family transcriptional regulator
MNGDALVSDKTRASVQAAMASLAYIPSSAARTMRSSKSGLVGLITGGISGASYGIEAVGLPEIYIVQGIQKVLAANGITVLISDTGGDESKVPRLFRTLQEHRSEGIIYVADHHTKIVLPPLDVKHLVLANCFDDAGTCAVVPDDEYGEYTLVAGLIARGHRRIGFLTLPVGLVAYGLRLAGYRRALAEAGIGFDPDLVRRGDAHGSPNETALVGESIDQLLALKDQPTVLCCGNDRLAVAVYGILRSKGVAVPAQMSVAGYDDYRVISEILFPPLTTVDLPYGRIGQQAAQLLVDMMRGDPEVVRAARNTVQGEAVWRDSVTVRDPKVANLKSNRRNG